MQLPSASESTESMAFVAHDDVDANLELFRWHLSQHQSCSAALASWASRAVRAQWHTARELWSALLGIQI